MDQPPRIETGETKQFTVVYSTPPGSPPLFTVVACGGLIIASVTATSSSSTQWFAMHTIVDSPNTFFGYSFVASFTVGSNIPGTVVDRGLFQAIRTRPW